MDIRSLRREKGLTQEKLAEMVQVDQTAISQWERGVTQPKYKHCLQLANVLHCQVEDIFYIPQERSLTMKTTYKETRRISATALRSLCIKMNWYTEGNNDEYGHLLFELADHKPHLDTADIIEIAEDIAAHSELNTAAGEDISCIAYLLAGIATVTFEEQKSAETPLYYGASSEEIHTAMKTVRGLDR